MNVVEHSRSIYRLWCDCCTGKKDPPLPIVDSITDEIERFQANILIIIITNLFNNWSRQNESNGDQGLTYWLVYIRSESWPQNFIHFSFQNFLFHIKHFSFVFSLFHLIVDQIIHLLSLSFSNNSTSCFRKSTTRHTKHALSPKEKKKKHKASSFYMKYMRIFTSYVQRNEYYVLKWFYISFLFFYIKSKYKSEN